VHPNISIININITINLVQVACKCFSIIQVLANATHCHPACLSHPAPLLTMSLCYRREKLPTDSPRRVVFVVCRKEISDWPFDRLLLLCHVSQSNIYASVAA
jgi:hypothetical protein